MRRTVASLLAALTLAAQPAWAERPGRDCRAAERSAFSSLPLLLSAGQPGRSGVVYCLANIRADAVEVRDGAGGFGTDRVPVENGRFVAAAGKVGNYHWLQAGEDSPAGVYTASTAQYFANPGPAPTAMLQLAKAELEVVPQPLPREHWRYRAGETWTFLVRFRGEPMPNLGVRLETSGGSHQVLKTDAQGLVRVTFPNDLGQPAARGGHDHGGGQNNFVLAAGLTDANGRYYLTGFNHVYGAAATQGRSLGAGLGFLLLGGLVAAPLVIKRKENGHG